MKAMNINKTPYKVLKYLMGVTEAGPTEIQHALDIEYDCGCILRDLELGGKVKRNGRGSWQITPTGHDAILYAKPYKTGTGAKKPTFDTVPKLSLWPAANDAIGRQLMPHVGTVRIAA